MSRLAVSLAAIAGMALATYATRVAGLALMARLAPGPRLGRFLRTVPAAILVAIIAPQAFSAGPAEAAATLATAAAAWRFRSLPLAMAVGVAAVFVLRLFLS